MKFIRISLFFLSFLFSVQLYSADRYWVGTTNNNWNNTGNWSSTSGGASGASVPDTNDRVLFRSNGNINVTLDIAPTVESMDISVGFTAIIDLNGNNLTINGVTNNDFEDGTINNTSGGSIFITCSGRTYLRGTTFNPSLTVSSARLFLDGSTFNGTSSFTKTGGSNDAGRGGNTFNGATSIGNSGTAYLLLGNVNSDTINGVLTLTNSGSSLIYLAHNSSGNLFNQNIIVNSTNGLGIRFGQATNGNATLADNRTISVGGAGFTSGDLRFRDFKQSGTTAQNISITGTGYIYSLDSEWGGNVTFSAPRILTTGTKYKGTVSLTKTGASGDDSGGGNVFDGNTTLTCSGSGHFRMGNAVADTFDLNLTLVNSGSSGIYIANSSDSNWVGGNLVATNSGTGSSTFIYLSSSGSAELSVGGNVDMTVSGSSTTCVARVGNEGDVNINGNLSFIRTSSSTTTDSYIAYGTNSTVVVLGNLTYSQSGSGSNGRFYLGNYGDVTITGNSTITNSSTANNSQIYCNYRPSSVGTYKGNIVLSSTIAGADGILFGSAGGTATLDSMRTVTAGFGGFISGDLYFRNFTQAGTTAQSFTNSGTGYIYNWDSDWGGNVIFSSGRINTRGTMYRGTATLSKTGGSDDRCEGGNTFTGDAILNNSGSRYFLMGSGSADVFFANLTMNNSGSHNMYLAYNSAGNSIAGNLVVNNSTSGTTNYIYISDVGSSTLSIGGNATINNTSTASNSNIYFGDDGDITLTGGLTFTGTTSGAASNFSIGQVSTSMVSIGGNATLTNSGSGTNSNMYFGNNGDVTLTGNLTLYSATTGTNGQSYVASGALSTVIIGGTAIVTNSGAGTTKRVYFANYGDVTVSDTLFLLNSSTAANSQIYCIDRSGSVGVFDGNIILESTTANTDGIYFGNNNGSGTLASTRTITIGSGGFAGGNLHFRNFSQIGSQAQTLTNTGIGYIYNYDCNWGGNVVFSSGRMYTRGSTYLGTANLTKTGASDDASIGGNSFTGDVVLTNSGSRYFGMGNGTSDTYGANVTINNTGTYHFYLAQNSAGNTIAGNLIVNNTGGSNNVYISNGTASTLTVNGTSTITNASTAASSYIYVGERGDIIFNDSVTLLNIGIGAAGQIQMANNASSVVSIIGNLNVTNSASGTTKRIYITNAGDLSITGDLTVTNSSNATTGEVYLANNSASTVTVGGSSTFSNSGAGTRKRIFIGYYGDITFTGNVSILNSSSANNSEVYSNDRTNSVNVFNGNITVENTNASGDGVRFGQNGGSATLAATKTITVSSGGFIAGQLYLRNFTQTSNTTQAITLTGTGYLYNYNSAWGGNVDFKAARFVTRGTTYSGTSILEKTGATDDASVGGNSFTGVCTMRNSGSGYFLMGNGVADTWSSDLTMISSGTDHMYIAHNSSGNTIGGNLVSTNNGTGNVYHYISTSNGSALSITGNATLSNAGSGTNIHSYFGNSGDITLTGNLITTNTSSGTNGYVYIANNTNSAVSIGGTATLTNSGAGTTKRTYLGSNGDVSLTGNLIISNSSSANNSQFYCNNSGNSSNTYGGNISVESTNASSDGVLFGNSNGSAIQNAGGSVAIGVGGFISGDLQFRNFTQLGADSSNLTLTGSARYYPYSSIFGGKMTVSTPRYYGRNTTYSSDFQLTMTGTSNNDSYGSNTFNSHVIVNMGSTGRLRLANNVANDYNGNVTFTQTTGTLQPAYNQPSTFAGDINVNMIATVTFGARNGTVVLDGTTAQSLNDIGSTSGLRFRRMTLNKASENFTLNEPLSIQTTATFTNGLLFSNTTNLLTFLDESTVSGVNNSSFVDGPVDKIGNNAFTFPVGDSTFYQPISMSNPNSNSSQFRAQYYYVDPSDPYSGASKEITIDHISTTEYWTLDRIATTSNVSLTLGWNAYSGGVDNLSELTVARWDVGSGIWRDHGNGGTTGNTTTGTVITSGAVTSFSPFTLASTTSNNPLPVDLLEFKAIPNASENLVDLFWVTSSEINNDYFTVEKTEDLAEFKTIAQAPGQGTTNETTEYHEIDYEPTQGVSYYRLSQTDFDGKTEYFDLEKVLYELEKNNSDLHVELYPNPNNGHNVYMKVPNSESDELNVLVSDFIGKSYLVDFTVINQGEYSVVAIEMNQKLAAGSYMINVNVDGKNHSHKLIVR